MSENIQEKDITIYVHDGLTAYGKSVIEERAFADVRDGLKPVHRAIIYELIKCGATSSAKPVKVARVGGNVVGNWHPHGNIAVEEALAGLAQDWTNSLPPVYVKGNGGTVFGDSAAAGRYIEAKLTPAGDAYGRNLKEGIVPFIPNFDETDTMPTVLPAQLPYLLINGISEGIAVGVASVMPPHNPREVIEMTIAYIKDPSMSTAQLLEIMPGPDFPTGATIINKDDLEDVYHNGVGRILCRATLEYDKSDNTIHVKEIPFNFSGNMNNLIAELAMVTSETVSNKKKVPPKIPGINKVEDYSGKDGIDICLYLQKGVDPDEMTKLLYAKTRLEGRVPFMFNALNDKEANQYSLKRYLSEYLDFQHEIILNEFTLEKKALEEKLEVITGRMAASQCVDVIIDIVKASNSKTQIKDVLMNGTIIEGLDPAYHNLIRSFRFTELQADAIAETKLYQLTRMDIKEMVKTGCEIKKSLADAVELTESEDARKALIINRLEKELKNLPDCPRKTRIIQDEASTSAGIETKAVPMFISMDKYGYFRMEGKFFAGCVETNSKARIGFFDEQGNCWNLYLDRVKETKDRGMLISRLLGTEARIIGFTTLIEKEDREGLFIFENGSMRRVLMSRFMTKSRATKINTKTKDTPMKAYYDIPEGLNIVVIDGTQIPLDRIPLQTYAGVGKQFLEQKEEPYTVSFIQGEVEPEKIPLGKDVFDGVAAFTEDGILHFDWTTLDIQGHEGLYVTTYQELIKQNLLFIHDDGTAKRIDGGLFAVKTKRTKIKGNKEGTRTVRIIPLGETGENKFLVGTYAEGYKKCVAINGISFQGIAGGGVRVFYTQKHQFQDARMVDKAPVPVLSFASQPKLYEEQMDVADKTETCSVEPVQYTTIGVPGFSCTGCGRELEADEPVTNCPECGAVFCKDCYESGNMDHQCEEIITDEVP